MSDDDNVVVPRGDTGAELLAVIFLKIPPGGGEDVCPWIEPDGLNRCLLNEMVGHDEEALMTQAETFFLHRGGDRDEGLSRSDFMGQKRVPAVEDSCYGVPLVRSELDIRVNAAEDQMASVVLPRPGGVEAAVVFLNQRLTAIGCGEYPVLELLLNLLLLLLGHCCGIGVEDALLLPLAVRLGSIDFHGAEVQRVLNDFISAGIRRPISGVRQDIA